MDITHIGADGNNIKARKFRRDDATFKTGVDDVNGGIPTRNLAVGAQIEVTQGRNGCVVPTGITAIMFGSASRNARERVEFIDGSIETALDCGTR